MCIRSLLASSEGQHPRGCHHIVNVASSPQVRDQNFMQKAEVPLLVPGGVMEDSLLDANGFD